MSQERLAMRKIKEILRLKWEAGLSNRAIARACKISNSTVSETVRRARAAGLSWPLPEELREDEVYQRLFPKSTPAAAPKRLLQEWAAVRQEMSKRGVTLKLLWQEYREKYLWWTHKTGHFFRVSQGVPLTTAGAEYNR